MAGAGLARLAAVSVLGGAVVPVSLGAGAGGTTLCAGGYEVLITWPLDECR